MSFIPFFGVFVCVCLFVVLTLKVGGLLCVVIVVIPDKTGTFFNLRGKSNIENKLTADRVVYLCTFTCKGI